MLLKVQHPLPTIGLELYQLGVHIKAKKEKNEICRMELVAKKKLHY